MVRVFHRIVRELFVLLSLLPGCTYLYPTKTPIKTLWYVQSENTHARLLIFLPGRYSSAASFQTEKFIEIARDAGLDMDMVAVDAHLGYYYRRTLLARLSEDVIGPAKKRGYSRFWVLGISLGGLGGLWFDTSVPGELEGLILLSPYLGDSEIVAEVAASGGIRAWHAPHVGKESIQRGIWKMLKNYEDLQRSRGRLFLGYGLSDAFAESNGMLAELVPAGQVFTVEGGHDWPTWRTLWEIMLKCPELQRDG